MRVIEIVGSRKATPEELKNAPGAATPIGQKTISIHFYYEADKFKSQGYWRGIGPESGTIINDDIAFQYALERCLQGTPEEQQEFRGMLIEWFYALSDFWIREREHDE